MFFREQFCHCVKTIMFLHHIELSSPQMGMSSVNSNMEQELQTIFSTRSFPPEYFISRNLFSSAYYWDNLHSRAPIVDYESYSEFETLLRLAREEYCNLIRRVVSKHFQTNHKANIMRWSAYDLIICGLADFPEFLNNGLCILLKITKYRGLQWVHRLNQHVATCLTTSCRTYVHTVQRITALHGTHPNAWDCCCMMQETLIDLLTSERSYNSTTNFIGQALIPVNFRVCYVPDWNHTWGFNRLVVHRRVWRLMKWQIMLLMYERCPDQDVAHMIFDLVLQDTPSCLVLDVYYQKAVELLYS
jgi:hypothetical protein